MAFRTQKISQMTPKGADLEATDLIEVSTIESGSYVTRSITGQELIDAIPLPPTGLTIGTTPIASGTIGRVLFEGTGNVLQQSSSLFWDGTNNRLGIGTSSPISKMQVITDNATSPFAFSSQTSQIAGTTTAGVFSAYSLTNGGYLNCGNPDVGWVNMTYLAGRHIFSLAGTEAMRITGGNVLINTTTDAGFKLDVNGTARVSGQLNFGTNVSASTSSGFGLNYINFNALTSGQGIAAGFSPNGTPGGYAYSFQFSKSSAANVNSLLFIGGGASAAGNSANKHIISTSADGTATGQPLVLRVATTSQSWGGVNDHLTIFPTGNVVIQNASQSATDAGFRLDVNGISIFRNTMEILTANGLRLRSSSGSAATSFRPSGGNAEIRTNDASVACMFLYQNGNVGFSQRAVFGSIILDNSAQVQIDSTTKGFLPPRMTTTERNAIASPAAGLIVYDTTLNLPHFFNGTIWVSL